MERGLVTREAVDRIVEAYESDIGPLNGARVVARAWVDPEFRRRLLEDGTAACRELGISGLRGEHLVVVEKRPGVHNAIVCTLWSWYPWAVLGLPPAWYKSPAYRSRMVIDPRGVLKEFGLELKPDTRVEVWDSSAETRYMILPERPPGTEHMAEVELAKLVTRDFHGGGGPSAALGARLSVQPNPAAAMEGTLALPRRNGELVFEHPWQSRVFGTTLPLHQGGVFEWLEFQRRLADRIAEVPEPAEAYYDRWLEALESLLGDSDVLSPAALAERAEAYESGELDPVEG